MNRANDNNVYLTYDIERVNNLLDPMNTVITRCNVDTDIFAFNEHENKTSINDNSVYLDVPNFMDAPSKISDKINICIFTINDAGSPYLTFLCHNYNKKISMIGLNINNNEELDTDSLITSIIARYTDLLNCDKDQLNYAGYTDNTNNTNMCEYTYIFQLHDKNINHTIDNYEWVTCWELINSNAVYGTIIDQCTIDFFMHNSSLLYLYNNDSRVVIPIVAYKEIKQRDIYKHTGTFYREKNIGYGLNMPHDRFFFYSSYNDCIKPNVIIKRILLFGDVSFIPNPMTVDIVSNIFQDTVSYMFNDKLIYALGNPDYIIL